MELLTDYLRDQFKKAGSQDVATDPLIIAKFFNPAGAGTWYASEYNPETKVFFGFVSIFGDYCDEWGTFSLQELESFRGAFGLGIERDRFFQPKRASAIEIIHKSQTQ